MIVKIIMRKENNFGSQTSHCGSHDEKSNENDDARVETCSDAFVAQHVDDQRNSVPTQKRDAIR